MHMHVRCINMSNKHYVSWSTLNNNQEIPSIKPFTRSVKTLNNNKINEPSKIATLNEKIEYCVNLFISNEMTSKILLETNTYAINNIGKPWADRVQKKLITLPDFQSYIGTRLARALRSTQSCDEMFSTEFPFALSPDKLLPMSKQRYHDVSASLHCEHDNGTLNTNGLKHTTKRQRKIDTLLILFQNSIDFAVKAHPQIALRELVIDEEMIKFQGRSSLVYSRQAKPISMGMKMWALCTSKGFLLSFTLSNGPGKDQLIHEVVMTLCQQIKGMWYVVYMDNLFSSVFTFLQLLELGVYACGTARKNRGVDEEMEMGKKDCQGSCRGKMALVMNANHISYYTWFDSGPVRALSTFHNLDLTTIKRKKKGYVGQIQVSTYQALADYNLYMHGVDISDQMRAACTISRRTIKW